MKLDGKTIIDEQLYARHLRTGRVWYRTEQAARDYAAAMTASARAESKP